MLESSIEVVRRGMIQSDLARDFHWTSKDEQLRQELQRILDLCPNNLYGNDLKQPDY